MSEKITIDEDELDDAIYETYKLYKDWHNLTHSENLLVMNFGDFFMENLFNKLKERIK